MVKKNKKIAFTLAEILIVLGVIGVIAAYTIPTLVRQYQDQATLSAIRKEFSLIQQTIKLIEVNGEGRICDWYSGTDPSAALATINTVLSKYLKVAKNCGTDPGCLPSENYKWLSNTVVGTPINFSDPSYSKMILADGTILMIYTSIVDKNGGSISFYVDVNGLKGPNRWGYDLFILVTSSYPENYSTNQVLTAVGNKDSTNESPLVPGCSSLSSGAAGRGRGCARWAVYKNTLDYKYGATFKD